MRNSASSAGRSSWLAPAWALAVALIALSLAAQLRRGIRFESSLLAMLPSSERDPALHELSAQLQGRAARTLLVLVGHAQARRATEAAMTVERELEASGEFESITGSFGAESERAVHELYFPLRYQLLSGRLRAELEAGAGADALIERVLDILHGPLSSAVSPMLERDPLLLHTEFLRSWKAPGLGIVGDNGYAMVQGPDASHAVIVAVTHADPFDARGQRAALDRLDTLARELAQGADGVTLAYTGIARFAARARERMQREVPWISLGSTIGTALCVWLTLRSARPLWLSFVPMLVSVLVGTWACVLIFPDTHLLTLVFGSSLTGMGVDYALHYFSVHRRAGAQWQAEHGLRAILPGITVGMLTSVVGFSGLYFTPFPLLRQFAVFASAGLVAAWLTVVAWFPALSRRPYRGPSFTWFDRPCQALLDLWKRWRKRRLVQLALVAAAGVAVLGWIVLPFADDIRELQNSPADLLAEDARLRELTGRAEDSRFVLVSGATDEQALENLERCTAELARATADGSLEGFHALTAFVPNRERQRSDHELLAQCLLPSFEHVTARLDELGFDAQVALDLRKSLETPPSSFIDVASFLESPASEPLRPLWLGTTSLGESALILLRGVRDASAVEQLVSNVPGARYIDRVRDSSELMRRYRRETMRLVALAYAAVLVVLVARFGLVAGLQVLLPACIAAGFTLWILVLCGVGLTLFHVLGLLLVLGLAVDYGAFLAESGADSSATMLALALSALTTIVAFGLMAASSAPPLQAIGVSVAIGIALALLLAPSAWRTP